MFPGFQKHDFVATDGTTWRGRAMLGGTLARALRPDLGPDCESWGVRRRLELHIARRSAYDFDHPLPHAKLFVYTAEELAYGFYVEAPGKRSEQEKYLHWCHFRDRLRHDGALRQALSAALAKHNLTVADYYRRQSGALRGQFRSQGGRIEWLPVGEATWRDSGFQELVDRVTGTDGDTWIDLHIFTEMERATAISLGRQVVEPIVAVLGALAPVYHAVIAPLKGLTTRFTRRPSAAGDRGR